MIIVRLILRIALSVTALTLLNVEIHAQPSVVTGKAVFASDAKVSTFPFEWHQGMIFVPVRINGSKPLSFVLDSGSSRILIDRSLATRLGLGTSGKGSLQGAGTGRIPIEYIHNVDVALPGVESSGYELATADLKPLQTSLGVKVDGILGYELSVDL